MLIHNAVLTGSFSYAGADLSNISASADYSASLSTRTTNLETASGSFSTRLTAVSSSQQQISASLLQVSASYIALSGSYNIFSGSASTRITTVSSSQQDISSSQQQISASLLNVIATGATTGSNSFRADQSITGSLVVSSTITAQTLVVQTVTSSIVYSSGSNIFGNQLANTQTFTGSVNITGSTNITGNINLVSSTGFPTVGLLNRSSDTTLYMVSPSNGFTLTDSSLNTIYNATPTVHNWNIGNSLKMKLDASGSLGLGVTPSAWQNTFGSTAFQLYGSYIYGYRDTNLLIGNNAYYDGTWKYYASGIAATKFNMGNGAYDWSVAPSGTAGNAITFTQAMTLDASGNLVVGDTSASSRLHIKGSSLTNTFRVTDAANYTIVMGYEGTGNIGMMSTLGSTAKLALGTNSTARLTIDGTGNVGIATSSPSYTLDVNGKGRFKIDGLSAFGFDILNNNGVRGAGFYNTGGNNVQLYFYNSGSVEKIVLDGGTGAAEFASTVTTTGVKFPATQVASADANTLDDYEEGTWTPVIGGQGGQSGQSYNGQAGYYIKIGRQVTVTFRVVLSNKGTITGEAGIKNLPFTADGTISYGSGATYFEGLATSWNSIFFMVNGSTTFASFDGTKSAGTATIRATTSDIGNSTQFNGSFTYLTT